MTSHPCKRTGRVAPVAPAPGERLVTLAVGAPGSPLDPRGGLLVHPMVQVVTALYSLAHDVGLTREEQGEVERTAPSLNGTLWRHTKALLRAADASPAGTLVDLGYTDLVLRWLGFADERGFEEAHGMGIGAAIGRARGRLFELVRALEGNPAAAEDMRCAVAWVWCMRSARLHAGLPGTGAAIVAAIERALEISPAGEDFWRPMLQSMVEVCMRLGDRDRAEAARERLEDLEREAERRRRRDSLLRVAAYLLSVLWCISHDEDLLASERGLDPEVEPSPGTWARVRSAVAGGEVEEIPLPLRTLAAWGMDESVTQLVLRSALVEIADALPALVRAVELTWGREAGQVSAEAAHAVACVLDVRHHELELGFEPLPGEWADLQHELIQGASRPETAERFALMSRALEALASRPEDHPMVYARVHLAAAVVLKWRGDPGLEREELDRAVAHASASVAPREERSEAEVCLAVFLWRCGDPGEARRRLRALGGPLAAGVLAEIETKEDRRRALRGAERVARDRGDAESRRRLALAHAAAGHAVEAERLATECVSLAPEDPLALATLAQVLHGNGRYRDAIEPARAALVRGHDEVAGGVLVARSLSRIGPEGREEATALALAVIDAHSGEDPLAGGELADMARIAHDGGAPIERCRLADDRVLALRQTADRAEELLGAAVARRCHGLFADDAPAWLARLAAVAAAEPVELARWLVERVEALQHFRLVAGRALFGGVENIEAERGLAARAEALLAERYGDRVGPEGVDLDDLPSGAEWERHLAVIEGAFGELGARVRASARAQGILFGPDGTGEREAALALVAVEAEHVAWIRWAGTCEALKEVAAGYAGGVPTGTLARLKPILDLAESGDNEAIRSAAWPNRWHEAGRTASRGNDAGESR